MTDSTVKRGMTNTLFLGKGEVGRSSHGVGWEICPRYLTFFLGIKI